MLLDEILSTFTVHEVWYCGVPGAGGDDALFVLGPRQTPSLSEKLRSRFCHNKPDIAVLNVNLEPALKEPHSEYGGLTIDIL